MINSQKILWCSLMAPYDKVNHASGKIENYYLKYLHSTQKYEIMMATFCKSPEIEMLDFDKYNIEYRIQVRKREGLTAGIFRIIAWLSKFNILNQYAGLTPCDISRGMKKMLRRLKEENYSPDLIILDWTEILFLYPFIRELFPDAGYIAIEEDVSFLGQMRRHDFTKNPLTRAFYGYKGRQVRELEIHYLNQCAFVILNNRKDERLAVQNGLSSPRWVWAPYFQNHLDAKPCCTSRTIIFYGAMFREENWKSALWFIDNVLPLIRETDIKFKIIGANPNPKLLSRKDSRVEIAGFVEDISTEISSALCLVAPLVLGAGIKIKVLEALSIGVPVLTNQIGIEGIPAVHGESYFHCEKPDDYVECITALLTGKIDRERVAASAKNVIRQNFDFEGDRHILEQHIDALLQERISDSFGKETGI